MAKRKLTDQQRTRIKDQQAKSLDEPGLVLANHGKLIDVLLESSNQAVSCRPRQHLGSIVAGDLVRVSPQHSVTARTERRNQLQRPDARGQLKTVAANVDKVFVVIAREPAAHANLIDRYLVAIAISGMQAVLVLNKSDLLNESDSEIINLLATYEGLGITVIRSSCETGTGFQQLRSEFAHGTGVLVGQSGVGKSSLVNSLLESKVAAVGALSQASGVELVKPNKAKGTHTTTTARLYKLPDGGALIDSPGIREFHLWHVPAEQVIAGFPDLAKLATECQFRDCSHQQEKGCRILQARRKDLRLQARWDSYQRIVQSLKS